MGLYPGWDSECGEGQNPAAARCKAPEGTSRPLARPRSTAAALAALLVRLPGTLAHGPRMARRALRAGS